MDPRQYRRRRTTDEEDTEANQFMKSYAESLSQKCETLPEEFYEEKSFPPENDERRNSIIMIPNANEIKKRKRNKKSSEKSQGTATTKESTKSEQDISTMSEESNKLNEIMKTLKEIKTDVNKLKI